MQGRHVFTSNVWVQLWDGAAPGREAPQPSTKKTKKKHDCHRPWGSLAAPLLPGTVVVPPHSKPTAYVAGRLGPWVAMVAADPNYSEPMIAWGDTEEVDVDSSRVTKFKGASGSSKLLLQCRRSRHVFGAVWSVVSVSQSVAGTQCSGP